MTDAPTEVTPFEALGGEEPVRALAMAFYDAMEQHEPALTKLHRLTPDGLIDPEVRARFALFLIGWLGGPQTYMAVHGHPRLRMRHAMVPIDTAMRDAWHRSMSRAMDACKIDGPVRTDLEGRFFEVADFLRNVAG